MHDAIDPATSEEARKRKQHLRAVARLRRDALPHQDDLSRRIVARLAALAEFAAARTVMSYVSFRSEVQTRGLIELAWQAGKQVVVPYCGESELHLFRLDHWDELTPGTMRILEPRRELRGLPQRQATVSDLDLIVVPGLAMDRHGGRIGYGKGYYDRLLAGAAASTRTVGVAFECQLFPAVPMLRGDMHLDAVVTERGVYERE